MGEHNTLIGKMKSRHLLFNTKQNSYLDFLIIYFMQWLSQTHRYLAPRWQNSRFAGIFKGILKVCNFLENDVKRKKGKWLILRSGAYIHFTSKEMLTHFFYDAECFCGPREALTHHHHHHHHPVVAFRNLGYSRLLFFSSDTVSGPLWSYYRLWHTM